jgi:FkbM family methyltransferase
MIESKSTAATRDADAALPKCVVAAMIARPPRLAQSVALDIGAHHGKFARSVLAELPIDTVFAFEPHADNFRKLCDSSAGCSKIVSANAAVGEREGSAWFGCNDDDATGSLLTYADTDTAVAFTERKKVPMVVIDTFCQDFADQGRDVRIIKIDTQGYDLAVLQGGEQTLLKHEPIVLLEFIFSPLYLGQAVPFEIESWMRGRGYKMVGLVNIHVDGDDMLAFADALFVPQSVSLELKPRFRRVDNESSWREQVATFERICAERLSVIETLDAEVTRLRNTYEPTA